MQTPWRKVILGSAHTKKGARHFVQKPVKPELLYKVIKYVLGDAAVTAATAAVRSSRQREG